MTEIMPVPRNSNFTVLPAESLRLLSFALFKRRGRAAFRAQRGGKCGVRAAALKGVFSFRREYPLCIPQRKARGVPLDPQHWQIAALRAARLQWETPFFWTGDARFPSRERKWGSHHVQRLWRCSPPRHRCCEVLRTCAKKNPRPCGREKGSLSAASFSPRCA